MPIYFRSKRSDNPAMSRVRSGLRKAQAELQRMDFRAGFRLQETNIRNLLASATTINEIAVATRKALEGLGIGGVNVYRYSSSGYIKSMAREELQGDSRYEKAGPILPGEKSHFIRSGLDILLVDRLMFDGFNDSDREAGKIDLEADLVKYFGSTYTEKYSGHISQLKDALRYNLYVKYPGDGKNDLIIMANTHVKNCQRVINKLRPEPVFSSDFQRDVIFETLRNLQRPGPSTICCTCSTRPKTTASLWKCCWRRFLLNLCEPPTPLM